MRTSAAPASLSFLLLGVLALSACSAPDTPSAPPPPEVSVVTLSTQSVSLTRELAGRTVPFLVAEVRPQVTGIVKRRAFTEGGKVEAGETLYEIDDASYRAARDSARAGLARAEATLTSTRLSANRASELAGRRLLSAQDNELAAAAYQEAQADVAAARAQLQAAEVTLGFANLVAPISGHIGKSSVTQGALVTANQADALATIQQLDPIYIDLAQSSSELLELRREIAAGTLEQADGVPVTILLEDGSAYAQQGRLQFSDITVDPRTGSYALRVLVPNPEGLLLPGMYVRAQVDMGQRPQGLLAPQQAITRDPKGHAVAMVVNAEGVVEARVLTANRTQGDQWLVDDGLQAGDRVIVEGLQKVRPGAPVRVIETGATSATSPAPADVDVE